MPDDLLYTKISPPRLPGSLIKRAELFSRLNQGLLAKVTLITAPTGFGKTTLVSQWLADQNRQAAWVTLDDCDNDPLRFWRYAIQAFRQRNEETGKTALAALRVAQQPVLDQLLTAFINDLAQLPAPLMLILDDYYTINSDEVAASLLFFIEHQPANLHIILLARSDPKLPLALLRARGELNELATGDLRFREEEIQAFTNQVLPVPLSTSALQRLAEKTEGWAAGIRLVTLAMQSKNLLKETSSSIEQFIDSFNGEHRFVLDYLRKEVLEKLPETLRTFLMQTCLFGRLCAPLCAELTGLRDSAVLLEQLERENLFVTALGQSGGYSWYRYQALFAEAIRHDSIQIIGEETVLALYEKASRWYAQNGLVEEAIEAALGGRQIEHALQLIEGFIDQHNLNEVLTLRRWCDRIPGSAIQQYPLIAFHYALALLFTLDRYSPATAALIAPLLQSAEHTWQAQGNTTGIGMIHALRSNIAWWQGSPQSGFQYAHLALDLLPENELLWRSVSLLGLGNEAALDGNLEKARNYLMEAQALSGAVQNIHAVLAAMQGLAEIEYQQAELDRSEALYQQVLAEAVGGVEMLDDQSIAWLGLARIAYERNDLRSAEEQANLALELSTLRANEEVWVPASILLAWIDQARGGASSAQGKVLFLLGRVQHSDLQREIWLNLALLSLSSADINAAKRCQTSLKALPGTILPTQQFRDQLLDARISLAEGDAEPGRVLVQSLHAKLQAQGRWRNLIEFLCLEAQVHAALANQSQANQILASALSLAQPKGLRRIFQDQGEPFIRLLQEALGSIGRQNLKLYATALLQTLPTKSQPASQNDIYGALTIEPLSPQEIRVLRLITAGRSNPEIAEALVVSVNTIKTQVQSIYRKLNITSRSEAREAAQALDLL